MKPRLRHIAVHAEEPHPGQFVWVLSERVDKTTWNEIQRADEPVANYKKAMAAGLVALQDLADDLEVGPRTSKAAPTSSKNAEDAASEADEADDADTPRKGPPAKKSIFGFGPAR